MNNIIPKNSISSAGAILYCIKNQNPLFLLKKYSDQTNDLYDLGDKISKQDSSIMDTITRTVYSNSKEIISVKQVNNIYVNNNHAYCICEKPYLDNIDNENIGFFSLYSLKTHLNNRINVKDIIDELIKRKVLLQGKIYLI